MVTASFLPKSIAAAFSAMLLAWPLAAAEPRAVLLVVLKNQPAHRIVTSRLSAPAAARAWAEADLRLAKDSRLEPARKLLAARLAEIKEGAAEIRAATAAEQDFIAARLDALGATGIRHYTAINMLGAEIPESAVDAVKQWSEVAELVPVGGHRALLDQIEQSLTSPTDLTVAVVNNSDAAFLRLLDRIIADRDALVAAGDGAYLFNGVPSSEYSVAMLAALGTFSHLPVKAVQLNGSEPNYLSDSVSDENPFRFYAGNTQRAFRSTLAWDRQFGEGLRPMLHSLNLFVYDLANGTELAAGATPNQSVQQTELPPSGDVLIKVRLESLDGGAAGEPFAVAISEPAFRLAKGPALAINCASDCTVSNNGDLPAFDVIAHAEGAEYKLGTIAARSSASFTPGKRVTRVTSQSFGEMFTTASDPCIMPWTLSSSAVTLDSSNQWTATVSVAPPAGCGTPWMAWLGPGVVNQELAVTSGGTFISGPGSVTVIGDRNPPVTPFHGTVYITKAELAGPYASFEVTDIGGGAPPSCRFAATLSSNSPLPFAYAGGNGSIDISAMPNTCAYTIVSSAASWLTINGTSGGSGTGPRGFTVTANLQPNGSTQQRSGAITVTGQDNSGKPIFTQTFSITENGLSCTYTPPKSVPNIPSAGLPAQSFTLAISNAACQWTASSGSPDFIVVQNDAKLQSGTLAGVITYSASSANNTTTAKPGFIQAGGNTVDVTQDPKTDKPTLFDGMVLAYEPDFHVFVTLRPTDITIKEKQSGKAVGAKVQNVGNDSDILKILGLDASKQYIITLTLKGYDIKVNNLEISKAQPTASFEVQLQIPAGQRKVTVTVSDAKSQPIRGAELKVTPTLTGESGDDGKWSFLLAKDDDHELVSVKANGYTFEPNVRKALLDSVSFASREFGVTGTIVLNLNTLDSKDDIDDLLNSISIEVNPRLPVQPAGTVAGNDFRWSGRGLNKGTDYTFKFSSPKLTFNPFQVVVKDESVAGAVTASKKK